MEQKEKSENPFVVRHRLYKLDNTYFYDVLTGNGEENC